MKRTTSLVLATLFSIQLFAQLNMTFVGSYQYDEELSDIWGYAASDGTEYALIGTFDGVSIVSLADPANPVESDFIPGPGSGWRDIKTWGNHAYVINETGDGLLVIDLSNLPGEVDYFYWQPDIPGLGVLNTCHNLWIDEFGYAYLVGCNLNNGGLLFIDVFSDPGNPVYAGKGAPVYSHDTYVRDNLAYSAEINIGEFSVYDVTDKSNPVYIASQETPALVTHNLWLSDNSQILFSTDETSNAPIASYDVTDPENIIELDQFRPLATLGVGVIPHNVHVWDDFLIISYYSDGCILVDAARPDNLIEIGNFDTFLPPITGFNGAWGAYPYLPSGLVLVSDIGNGLYVLEPNYVRACYLEGKITDAQTGFGISSATVDILGDLAFENSNLSGDYKTGLAVAGTYEVEVSKAGYQPKTVTVNLENGVVTELDVALEPLQSFIFTGTVKDAVTGENLPGAVVNISNDEFDFNLVTNGSGQFNIPAFYAGNYEIVAGKWGYKTTLLSALDFDQTNNSTQIELEAGLEDIFSLDLGWTVSGNATQGQWELGDPFGVTPPSVIDFLIQPEDDVQEDPGNSCYVTGNSPDLFSGIQVSGLTRLTSPVFDLSGMNQPTISLYYWIFAINQQNFNVGDDNLKIRLTNGIDFVTLGEFGYEDLLTEPSWQYFETNVSDLIPLSDQMQVLVEIGDTDPVDVAEAGIDFFRVWDADPTSTASLVNDQITLQAFPNPSQEDFIIRYNIENWNERPGKMLINNILGEIVEMRDLANGSGSITTGNELSAGIYFVSIKQEGRVSHSLKLVKQ